MPKIAIVGTTAWGITLGVVLARKGLQVRLWARTEQEVTALRDPGPSLAVLSGMGPLACPGPGCPAPPWPLDSSALSAFARSMIGSAPHAVAWASMQQRRATSRTLTGDMGAPGWRVVTGSVFGGKENNKDTFVAICHSFGGLPAWQGSLPAVFPRQRSPFVLGWTFAFERAPRKVPCPRPPGRRSGSC